MPNGLPRSDREPVGFTVAAMAITALLGIVAAFVETRDREPTRQSWTAGRTGIDWPTRIVHLLSGLTFTLGSWNLVDRIGWGPTLLCLFVFAPGILLSLYLDHRKAARTTQPVNAHGVHGRPRT